MDNYIKKRKREPYVGIPIKILTNKKVTDGAMRLYGLIKNASFFSKTGKCRITNHEIDKKLGMKKTTIWRHLKNLQENNILSVDIKKIVYNGRASTSRVITLNEQMIIIGI
jgi:biotin operon repressor